MSEGKLKDGRRYTVNAAGIANLKREYLVILDEALPADGECLTFPGVPAIGTAHPLYPGLVVSSYDVEEGQGKSKITLKVTANYAPVTFEVDDPKEGEKQTLQVDEWGWDDGTDEKELVKDIDGKAVVNSAGDPFESVPKTMTPAPIFTKSLKVKALQSGALDFNCKVNQSEVTIAGKKCPEGTLLCTVGLKRIIGDDDWKYQYTIRLRYKSNKVKLGGDSTETDVGWDVAILDAGMRAKQTVGEGEEAKEEVRLIRVIDKETGRACVVTTPALLNGNGYVRSETANDDPFVIRFKAYERATFPAWFYSEPSKVEEGKKDEGEKK